MNLIRGYIGSVGLLVSIIGFMILGKRRGMVPTHSSAGLSPGLA